MATFSRAPSTQEHPASQLPAALNELLALLPPQEQDALRQVWLLHRQISLTQKTLNDTIPTMPMHELVPPLNAFNGLVASSPVARLLPQVFTGYSYVALQTMIGGLSLNTHFAPEDIYTQQMQSMPPQAMLLSPNSCLRNIYHLGSSPLRTKFIAQLIKSLPEDSTYIAAVTLIEAPLAFNDGTGADETVDARNEYGLNARASGAWGTNGVNDSTVADPNQYFIPTIFLLTSTGYFVATLTLEPMEHPYLRFADTAAQQAMSDEEYESALALEDNLDAAVFNALAKVGIKRTRVELCPAYEVTIPPTHQDLFSTQLHKLAHSGHDFTVAIPSDFALSWVLQPALLSQLLRAGTSSPFDPNYLTGSWALPLNSGSVIDTDTPQGAQLGPDKVAPRPAFAPAPSRELQTVWLRLPDFEHRFNLGGIFDRTGKSVIKDVFNLNLVLDQDPALKDKDEPQYWVYMSLPQEHYAHEEERIRLDVETCLANANFFTINEAQRRLRKSLITTQYTIDELALQRHVLQKLGTLEVTNVIRPLQQWQEIKSTTRHLMAQMRAYLQEQGTWQPQVRPFTLTRFYDGTSRRAGLEIDGRSLVCLLYPEHFDFEDFTASFDLPLQQECYAQAQTQSWRALYSGLLHLTVPQGQKVYLNVELMQGAIFVLGLMLSQQHHVQQRLKELIATINHATHGLSVLLQSQEFTSCPYALHQELRTLHQTLQGLQQRHNALIAATHCNEPSIRDFLQVLNNPAAKVGLGQHYGHTLLCLWTLGLLGLDLKALTANIRPHMPADSKTA